MDEVFVNSATREGAQTVREYLSYIDQPKPGHIGRFRPIERETICAVRRGLGVASRLSGEGVIIKQLEDEIYFWIRSDRGSKWKRGMARNTAGT